MTTLRGIACSCLLVPFVSLTTTAQLETSLSGSAGGPSAAYYRISKAGEITMPVNLWGFVKNPGRYEIPISTDLVQLVSLAGGPLMEADISSVKITRLVRSGSDIRKVEFMLDLSELHKLDEKALRLEPGDTIYMASSPFSGRDIFDYLTAAAVVVTAVSSIMYTSYIIRNP